MISGFLRFSREREIPLKINEYRPLLKRYLKATMAQQLFGNSEFQRIINNDDRIIEKVIELSETN
jgi:carboxyl-terminal processing protease